MGLRCSELCGLMWEDIDTEKAIMHIRRACVDNNGVPMIDKPKNKTSLRSIPIPSDLNERLKTIKDKGYLSYQKTEKISLRRAFLRSDTKHFSKTPGFPN